MARPTLPPLRSLQLPVPAVHDHHDPRDPQTPSHTYQPPSPLHTPSLFPSTPVSPPAWSLARKVRLVPTSFENADAVVLVPPPGPTPDAPPPQPLLLVGSALARLRSPQRQLAKGARVHPYRIVRSLDRRPPAGPSEAEA